MKQLFPFLFLIILCVCSCSSNKKNYYTSFGKKYVCAFEGDKDDIDHFLDKSSIYKQDSIRLLELGSLYTFYNKRYKYLIGYSYLEDEQVFTTNPMHLSSIGDWYRNYKIIIDDKDSNVIILKIMSPGNARITRMNKDIILKCTKENEVSVEEYRNKKTQ